MSRLSRPSELQLLPLDQLFGFLEHVPVEGHAGLVVPCHHGRAHLVDDRLCGSQLLLQPVSVGQQLLKILSRRGEVLEVVGEEVAGLNLVELSFLNGDGRLAEEGALVPVLQCWNLRLLNGVCIICLDRFCDGRWRLAPLRVNLLRLVRGFFICLEEVCNVLHGLIVRRSALGRL